MSQREEIKELLLGESGRHYVSHLKSADAHRCLPPGRFAFELAFQLDFTSVLRFPHRELLGRSFRLPARAHRASSNSVSRGVHRFSVERDNDVAQSESHRR